MAILKVKQADGTWREVPAIGGSGSGGGSTYVAGDNIRINGGIISVVTTNEAEKDNTRPITSAGVYATIGNIEALLKTI